MKDAQETELSGSVSIYIRFQGAVMTFVIW